MAKRNAQMEELTTVRNVGWSRVRLPSFAFQFHHKHRAGSVVELLKIGRPVHIMKQQALNDIANKYLQNSDTPLEVDGDDLVNALLVLQSVAHSLAWKHYQHLTLDQRCILAYEFGNNLRQSITLFTGIDPADAVHGQAEWPEEIM